MPVVYEPDGSCVAGCTSHFGWCDDRFEPCPLCEDVKCAWRTTGLAKMIEAHAAKLQNWRVHGQSCDKGGHVGRSRCHNEVVLAADAWRAHMPDTIEAIFFQRTSRPESVSQAHTVHSQFLSQYAGARVPLVEYDESSAAAPFTLVA
jgi:hypothetical protein